MDFKIGVLRIGDISHGQTLKISARNKGWKKHKKSSSSMKDRFTKTHHTIPQGSYPEFE